MSDFVECPRCKADLIIQDGKDMEKAISHLRTELEEIIVQFEENNASGLRRKIKSRRESLAKEATYYDNKDEAVARLDELDNVLRWLNNG